MSGCGDAAGMSVDCGIMGDAGRLAIVGVCAMSGVLVALFGMAGDPLALGEDHALLLLASAEVHVLFAVVLGGQGSEVLAPFLAAALLGLGLPDGEAVLVRFQWRGTNLTPPLGECAAARSERGCGRILSLGSLGECA